MKSYDLKELSTANKKVDKVTGKDLSSNDFNNTYKSKLDWYIANGSIGGITLTSSDLTAYTGTYSGLTSYYHGLIFAGLNNKTGLNNANATLNLNSLGAKPIYYKNQKIQSGEFPYRSVSLFLYVTWSAFNSGQGAWILIDDRDTTYTTATTEKSGLMGNDHVVNLNKVISDVQSLENHRHGRIKGDQIINSDGTVPFNPGPKNICTDDYGFIIWEDKNNHTHGNITSAGAIGSTEGQVVTTTTNGVLTTTDTVNLTASFTDGSTATYKILPGS